MNFSIRLNGQPSRLVNNREKRPGPSEIFLDRLPAALPITKIVDDEYPTGAQKWIKLLQLVECRFIPVGVESQYRDLVQIVVRNGLKHIASDEMNSFFWIPRRKHVLANIFEACVTPAPCGFVLQ